MLYAEFHTQLSRLMIIDLEIAKSIQRLNEERGRLEAITNGPPGLEAVQAFREMQDELDRMDANRRQILHGLIAAMAQPH